MILSDSLKKIRSLQDLRAEKYRLRYEAMRAEYELNGSIEAIGKAYTMLSYIRRAGTAASRAFNIATSLSRFIYNIFQKKTSRKEPPPEQDNPSSM